MSLSDEIEKLNAEQKEAVLHWGSPLLILAGAGAGKTKVITTKIAYLVDQGFPAFKILAVTFTNKAANEMKERATKLCAESEQSSIKTFHSFGAWFLRRFYAEFKNIPITKNFSIYDDTESANLLAECLPGQKKQVVKKLQRLISRAKDDFLLPQDISFDTEYSEIKEAYDLYEQRLRATGNVDFGDLIMLPTLILQKNLEVKKHIHNLFEVILVDEFQDTNIAQMELLKALISDKSYLCVVGDDDQSIYKFRGASISNILTFQKTFPNTKIIKLEKNYRSTPQILNVANAIIKNNDTRLGKTLQAMRKDGCKPTLFVEANQTMEAERIAELIFDDVSYNKNKYSNWAILYRTNSQSRTFETKFLQANIPYKVIGSVRFYEREEVKDTVAILRLVLNLNDEIAFKRIINKPTRGIGSVSQKKLFDAITSKENVSENSLNDNLQLQFKTSDTEKSNTDNTDKQKLEKILQNIERTNLSKNVKKDASVFFENIFSLREALTRKKLLLSKTMLDFSLGLSGFIANAVELFNLAEYYQTQDEIQNTQKLSNLQELISMAVSFEFSLEGLTYFLETISLDSTVTDKTKNDDAVTLITIHGTKGLEFDNVVITGLEENVFPIIRSDNENDIEEERRLMYVACTRAKNKLFMTAVQNRIWAGVPSTMQLSRFISEVDENLIFKKTYLDQSIITTKIKQKFPRTITNPTKTKAIDQKWEKGKLVYSYDYGYGKITRCEYVNEVFCFEVRFENNSRKVFFPAYNSVALEIIDSNSDEFYL